MALMGPLQSQGGSSGGSGFLGGLGSLLAGGNPVLGALGGLFGGLFNNNQFNESRDFITGNSEFNPLNGGGFGGSAVFGGGNAQFTESPQTQALRSLLGGSAAQGFGGGLFNDPNFQQAFGQNDIAGALGQSNNALGQQAQGTAFGGLEGLFNQSQGLGQFFGGLTAQGPQDFSGGLQNQLFNQGFQNQQDSLDQSALFNQFLGTQRDAVSTQNNDLFNKLENRQFAQGRLGTTGGAEQTGSFFDALNQQDLGFQNNAFGLADKRSNFLANLGSQQIGQGSGLLSQNLGQFNQNAQLANLFNNSAAGFEGQQFGQNLGALQQNQSAGTQRLQNALGLFGQGVNTQNIGFNQGLGATSALQNQNQFGLDALLGFLNSENGRIGATGNHSLALSQLQSNSGGGLGGFLGGLFGG